MLIRLFVVLSIFSSEKPARSYCQDLIKDLKASSPDGCVLHLLVWCADHAVDDSGRHDVSHEDGNRAVCPVDCNDGHHSGAPDQAEYRHDDHGKFSLRTSATLEPNPPAICPSSAVMTAWHF